MNNPEENEMSEMTREKQLFAYAVKQLTHYRVSSLSECAKIAEERGDVECPRLLAEYVGQERATVLRRAMTAYRNANLATNPTRILTIQNLLNEWWMDGFGLDETLVLLAQDEQDELFLTIAPAWLPTSKIYLRWAGSRIASLGESNA
jgi:hypothetical protein